MTNEELKTLFEIIESAVTTTGIIVAGYWAIFIYGRQRENHPHIQFSADIILHKKIGNWWIAELIACVENKGKVRHKIHDFEFDLYAIRETDDVVSSSEYRGQVNFPLEVAKGSFLRHDFEYYFIEPGVTAKYSYVTRIPANSEAVIFHTWFKYPNSTKMHVAEKTTCIPKGDKKSNDLSKICP